MLVDKHLGLVMKANESVNLTRIHDKEEAMILHVEDSLTALPELNEAPKGLYGDMGSGAGYPGIPLAIATGRETLLVDARMKKMEAVKAMLEEMGLAGQINVFSGRAELLARKQPNAFSALTARALSKLGILLELASPLLFQGGHLICYKSHVEEGEYNHALEVANQVGMRLISDREFTLGENYQRRILVYEKKGNSKVKLPRQEGAAQKNPL